MYKINIANQFRKGTFCFYIYNMWSPQKTIISESSEKNTLEEFNKPIQFYVKPHLNVVIKILEKRYVLRARPLTFRQTTVILLDCYVTLVTPKCFAIVHNFTASAPARR